jgi:hypothetical protein
MAVVNWDQYLANNPDVANSPGMLAYAQQIYGANVSPQQVAKLHYDLYGRNENRNTSGLGYYADSTYGNMSAADKAIIDKQQFQQTYGGMGAASLGDFNTLLDRLEGSKIRQQQAKDISVRPSIYAEGLAKMMSNF